MVQLIARGKCRHFAPLIGPIGKTESIVDNVIWCDRAGIEKHATKKKGKWPCATLKLAAVDVGT